MTEPSEGTAYPVERNTKGQFVKGQSGNPAGKARGVKNAMTLERLAFERGLRQYVSDPERAEKLLCGIDRVLDIAIAAEKDSDAVSAMKLMLDRVMPAMPPKVSEDAEKTDTKLQIVISTNPDAKVPVEAVTIHGEFQDITEDK
jgi:hypothetical protein